MKLSSFLKEKTVYLTFQLAIILFLAIILGSLKISMSAIILICFSTFLLAVISLSYEYIKKARFYKRVLKTLDELEKKHFIGALMETPDFEEGYILFDILQAATKSMNDEIADYRHLNEEYRDYIETWIHEIKLPISTIDLMCENHKNEVTDSIRSELSRIESFVEQALYYAKSSTVEKDYSVHSVNLDTLVKTAIKKHSKQLIGAKTKLIFKNLDKTVYCDEKWLIFILGQILSNSIKYQKENLNLAFRVTESKESIVLSVSDNGIGIPEKDISRVFEKGFTGQNGRCFAKSTGIGLYLCKRLCDKMYLGFDIQSTVGSGTTLMITFPKDSRILLET